MRVRVHVQIDQGLARDPFMADLPGRLPHLGPGRAGKGWRMPGGIGTGFIREIRQRKAGVFPAGLLPSDNFCRLPGTVAALQEQVGIVAACLSSHGLEDLVTKTRLPHAKPHRLL